MSPCGICNQPSMGGLCDACRRAEFFSQPAAPSISMRDYFAAQAITGLFVDRSIVDFEYASDAAKSAYAIADAMLADRAKVLAKEKDTRTWAWNASYHRKCLARAQREIEYHTAKLNVAAIKSKSEAA